MRPNFVFEEPYIRRFPGADFHFLCVDIDDLDLHVGDDNCLVESLGLFKSWLNIRTYWPIMHQLLYITTNTE